MSRQLCQETSVQGINLLINYHSQRSSSSFNSSLLAVSKPCQFTTLNFYLFLVSTTCNFHYLLHSFYYLQFQSCVLLQTDSITCRLQLAVATSFHYLHILVMTALLHVSSTCTFCLDIVTYIFLYLHIQLWQPYLLFLVLAHSSWTLLLTYSDTCTFNSGSLTSCFWYLHILSGHCYLHIPIPAHSHLTTILIISDTCRFLLDTFACSLPCLHIQPPLL